MKSLTKSILAIAFIVFSFAIGNAQNKKVKGNGNVTTKIHNTEDYSKINVVGFMDVKLVSGAEGTISVTTDDNIQEYIKIESKDGKLTIKVKNKVNITTKKEYILPYHLQILKMFH